MRCVRSAAPRTVLIVGATGRQGGAVLRALQSANARAAAAGAAVLPWAPVALTRDPSHECARALARAGVRVERADSNARASLDAVLALCGPVHGFFAVTNPFSSRWSGLGRAATDVGAEERQGRNMADACLAAGVQHLVFSSAAGAGEPGACAVPTLAAKARIEGYLAACGVSHSVVAPAGFMENFLNAFAGLRAGLVPSPFSSPDTVVQLVAADDVGAAVALLMAAPAAWRGRRLELAGDTLALADVARVLERLRAGERWKVATAPPWALALFMPAAIASITRFLEEKKTRVDVDACRRLLPGILSFEAWARANALHTRQFDTAVFRCELQ